MRRTAILEDLGNGGQSTPDSGVVGNFKRFFIERNIEIHPDNRLFTFKVDNYQSFAC